MRKSVVSHPSRAAKGIPQSTLPRGSPCPARAVGSLAPGITMGRVSWWHSAQGSRCGAID
jgi:hypothetical protein